MKSYMFAYSQLCPDWQAQAILDATQAVTNWIQPFPNAAIIQSSLDARDLAAVLRSRLGQTWFLVSELHSASVDGWLPGNAWQFVNTPGGPLPFLVPHDIRPPQAPLHQRPAGDPSVGGS